MSPSLRRGVLLTAVVPVLALSGCAGPAQDAATTVAALNVAPVLVHDAPVPVPLERGASPVRVACHPQPSAPPTTRPEALTQSIAVVVPATTLVRLDAAGRAVQASTNTGQAPCRTDVFVVERDGITTPAPAAVRAAVLAALTGSGGGGWTPGAWRPVL